MSEEKSNTKKKYYDQVSVGNRTKQRVFFVQNHDKNRMFEELLKTFGEKKILLFVKSKRSADELREYLANKDITALCAHGNHRASQIQERASAFNSQKSGIFITTDKIFEKLTFEGIEVVISYDLPLEAADYFKRLILVDEIGEGITFVDPDDEATLARVEHMMKCEMQEEEFKDFEHTKLERSVPKDKTKKPRHKKVEQRAKRKAEIKSKWVPST
jgi:superfamily II DNA/RNA helicase